MPTTPTTAATSTLRAATVHSLRLLRVTCGLTSAAWLVMLLLTSVGRADLPRSFPMSDLVAEAPLGAAEARALAAEAYVWGWAPAYVHQVRTALERVPCAGRSGGMPVAPINRLAMLADRVTHRLRGIACPNQDVFYGFGMFDLEASPVVLQVPDFGGRFWLYQLGDQRTDAFADFGIMHGTKPGCHLVVGPSWSGTPPAGIVGVVRSPTRFAYCIPRIFFSDAPGDREAALPLVNEVVAYPLDEYTGDLQTTDWTKSRWLPDLTGKGRRGIDVSPAVFLDLLRSLLEDIPPRPGEEAVYARMWRLVRSLDSEPALRDAVCEALHATDRDVVAPLFHFRNVGHPLPTGWTTLVNGGEFGTDYLTRTAVARSNVFVNRRRETAYFFLDVDGDGHRLDGSREYRLTFPPGSLPPARGFWSLTVYDERHGLPDDPGGRHSIGSRTPSLTCAPDGSLTIVIGPRPHATSVAPGDAPAAEPAPDGQRLSAPSGDFSLYLRLYWPEPAAIEGAWAPPALVATNPADRGMSGPAQPALQRNPVTATTSQNVAVSLTYAEFTVRVESTGTEKNPPTVSQSLTGHHGGGSVRPGSDAREARRR